MALTGFRRPISTDWHEKVCSSKIVMPITRSAHPAVQVCLQENPSLVMVYIKCMTFCLTMKSRLRNGFRRLDTTPRCSANTILAARVHEEESRHPNDGFETYEWVLGQGVSIDSPFNAYISWLQQNHPEFHQRLLKERRKLKYVPRECHLTHWAAERTIDFLKNRDR